MTVTVDIADDAKLQTLVEAVEHGDEVTVTRNGHPVARIVRTPPPHDRAAAAAAADRILELGSTLTLGPGLTIRHLIDEGRKY